VSDAGSQIPKLKIVLVLVVVLVLGLLGLCVETKPESPRTISFYQRDGEITRLLEHGRAGARARPDQSRNLG
jgi:hypothetical protein